MPNLDFEAIAAKYSKPPVEDAVPEQGLDVDAILEKYAPKPALQSTAAPSTSLPPTVPPLAVSPQHVGGAAPRPVPSGIANLELEARRAALRKMIQPEVAVDPNQRILATKEYAAAEPKPPEFGSLQPLMNPKDVSIQKGLPPQFEQRYRVMKSYLGDLAPRLRLDPSPEDQEDWIAAADARMRHMYPLLSQQQAEEQTVSAAKAVGAGIRTPPVAGQPLVAPATPRMQSSDILPLLEKGLIQAIPQSAEMLMNLGAKGSLETPASDRAIEEVNQKLSPAALNPQTTGQEIATVALGSAPSMLPLLAGGKVIKMLGAGPKTLRGALALGEGLQAGQQNALQVAQEIRSVPIDVLKKSADWQELYDATPEWLSSQQRDLLVQEGMAIRRGLMAGGLTIPSTALFSHLTQAGALGRALDPNLAKSRLRRLSDAIVSEAVLQEGPQSFGENVISSVAAQPARPGQTAEGVLKESLKQGALGAAAAGITSAGPATLAALPRQQKPAGQTPPPIPASVQLPVSEPAAPEQMGAKKELNATLRPALPPDTDVDAQLARQQAKAEDREAMPLQRRPTIPETPQFTDPNDPKLLDFLYEQGGLPPDQIVRMSKPERLLAGNDPTYLQELSAAALKKQRTSVSKPTQEGVRDEQRTETPSSPETPESQARPAAPAPGSEARPEAGGRDSEAVPSVPGDTGRPGRPVQPGEGRGSTEGGAVPEVKKTEKGAVPEAAPEPAPAATKPEEMTPSDRTTVLPDSTKPEPISTPPAAPASPVVDGQSGSAVDAAVQGVTYSVGTKVQLPKGMGVGKTGEIVEVMPQEEIEREAGEQFYKVKLPDGTTQNMESADLKPVKKLAPKVAKQPKQKLQTKAEKALEEASQVADAAETKFIDAKNKPPAPAPAPVAETKAKVPTAADIDGAVNRRKRDELMLAKGQYHAPGLRLGDQDTAGSMAYLVERGDATIQEWNEWVERAKSENRFSDPNAPIRPPLSEKPVAPPTQKPTTVSSKSKPMLRLTGSAQAGTSVAGQKAASSLGQRIAILRGLNDKTNAYPGETFDRIDPSQIDEVRDYMIELQRTSKPTPAPVALPVEKKEVKAKEPKAVATPALSKKPLAPKVEAAPVAKDDIADAAYFLNSTLLEAKDLANQGQFGKQKRESDWRNGPTDKTDEGWYNAGKVYPAGWNGETTKTLVKAIENAKAGKTLTPKQQRLLDRAARTWRKELLNENWNAVFRAGQTVNATELRDGDLVLKDNEWHKVSSDEEAVILKDGKTTRLGPEQDFKADAVVAANTPMYAEAVKEYEKQEGRKMDVPATVATKALPLVKEVSKSGQTDFVGNEGGFKLTGETVADNEAIAAEKKAKEEAKAKFEAAQPDMFTPPSSTPKYFRTDTREQQEKTNDNAEDSRQTLPDQQSKLWRNELNGLRHQGTRYDQDRLAQVEVDETATSEPSFIEAQRVAEEHGLTLIPVKGLDAGGVMIGDTILVNTSTKKFGSITDVFKHEVFHVRVSRGEVKAVTALARARADKKAMEAYMRILDEAAPNWHAEMVADARRRLGPSATNEQIADDVYDQVAEELAADRAIDEEMPTGTQAMRPTAQVKFKRTTPAQDAAYLAAVKRGDMETAQRMVDEAAKRAGSFTLARSKFSDLLRVRQMSAVNLGVSGRINDSKVLDPIIEAIPVEMMNVLGTKERASDALFNNPAVFQDALVSSKAKNLIGEDAISRLRDAAMGVAAGARAELASIPVAALDREMFAAVDALQHNLVAAMRDESSIRGSSSTDALGVIEQAGRQSPIVTLTGTEPTLSSPNIAGMFLKLGTTDFADAFRFHREQSTLETRAMQELSFDPVTRDNQGRVIPLSERFNEQSPDIRFKRTSVGKKPFEPPHITGTKNAYTKAMKDLMGFNQLSASEQWTEQAALDKALEKIAANKNEAKNLVTRMLDEPFVPTASERMVLLHEMVVREQALNEALTAVENAPSTTHPAIALANEQDIETARATLDEIYTVAQMGSREWGRAGLAMQRSMDNHFSMTELTRAYRKAKGSDLTTEDTAKLQALADEYQKAKKTYEASLAAKEEELSKAKAEAAFAEELRLALLTAPPRRTFRKKATALFDQWDAEYEAYMRTAAQRATALVDPMRLLVMAKRGASIIGRGAFEVADWTAKMRESFRDATDAELSSTWDRSRMLAEAAGRRDGAETTTEKKPATPKPEGTPEKNESLTVKELMRLEAESGVTDVETAIRNVTEILKAERPDITERNVQDEYGDYNKKHPELSKDAIDKQLRDWRAQAQKLSQLQDALVGLPPHVLGIKRDEPSQRVRELTKQVHEAMKAMGIPRGDPSRRLKSALEAVKTRLKNQIADLQKAIATNKRIPRGAVGIEYDTEANRLVAERDALQVRYDDIFTDPEMTDQQRLEEALRVEERNLESWNRRLENAKAGVFGREAKTSQPWSPQLSEAKKKTQAIKDEVQRLRDLANPKLTEEERALKEYKARLDRNIKYGEERIRLWDIEPRKRAEPVPSTDPDVLKKLAQLELIKLKIREMREMARVKNLSLGKFLIEKAAVGLHTQKNVISAFDISAIGRQGGLILLSNPRVWASSLVPMFRSISKEQCMRINAELVARENSQNGAYKRAKLAISKGDGMGGFTQIEDAHRLRLSERIPGVGASNRTYATFLNKVRADMFDKLVRDNYGDVSKATTQELQDIAAGVNEMTGRGNWGSMEQHARGLSLVMWAPRFFKSALDVLTVKQLRTGSTKSRKIFAKQYLRMAGSLALIYTVAALFRREDDDEVELNPKSAAFGAIHFGNYTINPIGFARPTLTFLWRVLTGQSKTEKGFKNLRDPEGVIPILGGQGDVDAPVPFGSGTMSTIGQFAQSKAHPGLGIALSLATGKQFGGRLTQTKENMLKEAVYPLTARQSLESFETESVVNAAILALLNMAGVSVTPDYSHEAIKKRELRKKEENTKKALRPSNYSTVM